MKFRRTGRTQLSLHGWSFEVQIFKNNTNSFSKTFYYLVRLLEIESEWKNFIFVKFYAITKWLTILKKVDRSFEFKSVVQNGEVLVILWSHWVLSGQHVVIRVVLIDQQLAAWARTRRAWAGRMALVSSTSSNDALVENFIWRFFWSEIVNCAVKTQRNHEDGGGQAEEGCQRVLLVFATLINARPVASCLVHLKILGIRIFHSVWTLLLTLSTKSKQILSPLTSMAWLKRMFSLW